MEPRRPTCHTSVRTLTSHQRLQTTDHNMAPIRRYLRITKYSVLECRIYLDNPALAQSWLLNPRDPVLPRVIQAVRPLVLPKLREEQERERSNKKNKKRSIKDVVVQGKSVSQLTTWARRLLSHYSQMTSRSPFS